MPVGWCSMARPATSSSPYGPHHFDDYFARGDLEALQPLCDALA